MFCNHKKEDLNRPELQKKRNIFDSMITIVEDGVTVTYAEYPGAQQVTEQSDYRDIYGCNV